MSPLPIQMADHWSLRPGRTIYHWHILFHDQPAIHALVRMVQRKLEGLPNLDIVPSAWLHLTTLVVGIADEVTREQVGLIVTDARRRLAGVAPIPVTVCRIFYHPEAVVLPVEPLDALTPVLDAVRAATLTAGCQGRTDTDPWLPHISVAYSNAARPAAPIIAALGRRLPDTKVTIGSASLVAQSRVGHSWQWELIAEVDLAAHQGAAP